MTEDTHSAGYLTEPWVKECRVHIDTLYVFDPDKKKRRGKGEGKALIKLLDLILKKVSELVKTSYQGY